jgi:histidinol-phosphatase (PHP family)
MFWTNFHSHCEYCDGVGKMETYIQAAINQKVKVYGFSSHAPLPFQTPWAMQAEQMKAYLKEITFLKQKYQSLIEIYSGLEIDFIPKLTAPDNEKFRELALDFSIGSVHFVDFFPDGKAWEIDNTTQVFKNGLESIFNNKIKSAIKRYYGLTRKMLKKHTPDIVGHLDKIKIHNKNAHFFSEKEKWYVKEVLETLEVIAKAGSILEVNTAGIYKKNLTEPYPSYWVLEEAFDRKIPIMINSDVHHPNKITQCFTEVSKKLHKIGYRSVKVLYQGIWQDIGLDKEGLYENTRS